MINLLSKICLLMKKDKAKEKINYILLKIINKALEVKTLIKITQVRINNKM